MFEFIGHIVMWLIVASVLLFIVGQSRWAAKVLGVSLLLVVKVVAAVSLYSWLQNNVHVDSTSWWWLLAIPVVLLCAVAYGIWITLRFAWRNARRVAGSPHAGSSIAGALVGALLGEVIRHQLQQRGHNPRRIGRRRP